MDKVLTSILHGNWSRFYINFFLSGLDLYFFSNAVSPKKKI